MYNAILFEKTLQILYPTHLEGQYFELQEYYNRHDFILNHLNEKNNNEFNFYRCKRNEMIDCLDEHIKEKKIRPENVYSCIKKIKTDEFKKSLFFHQIVNNDIKKQIEKKHKIKSLLYLMVYKNAPQDLVRYCIKSYL